MSKGINKTVVSASGRKKESDPFADYPMSDMDYVKTELNYLRCAIDRQNKSIAKVMTLLKQLKKQEVTIKTENEITFPVETEDDLQELDTKIGENPEKYHDILREIVFGTGGIEKSLKYVISSEVALQYNWDGTSGKKPFKNFKNINVGLYNAVHPEITSPEVYKKAIRQGLKRIKNLHFKRVSMLKKESLRFMECEPLSP